MGGRFHGQETPSGSFPLVPRDHGVQTNQGGEETRVHQGEVDQDVGAEGVAYSYYGTGHFCPKVVDRVEEVTGVVEP